MSAERKTVGQAPARVLARHSLYTLDGANERLNAYLRNL